MSAIATSTPMSVVCDYINACCVESSVDKLKEILAKKVKFVHKRVAEKRESAADSTAAAQPRKKTELKKIEDVIAIYNNNLFKVTSDIVIRKLILEDPVTKIELKQQKNAALYKVTKSANSNKASAAKTQKHNIDFTQAWKFVNKKAHKSEIGADKKKWVKITLDISENKSEGTTINRYRFIDHSKFSFRLTKNGKWKIRGIAIHASKTLVVTSDLQTSLFPSSNNLTIDTNKEINTTTKNAS